jgi:hypothetical protein
MKSVFLLCSLFFISIFANAQNAGLDSATVIQKDQLYTLVPTEDLSVKGQVDAEKHYKKYKGAATGTLIASLVSPIVGLVPAIITSSTTPRLENLGYPDESLFKQADYHNAYTRKAKKMKAGKVWKNWGIGFGVNLVLVLIIAAGQ